MPARKRKITVTKKSVFWPCGSCRQNIQTGIQCDACTHWYHAHCQGLSEDDLNVFSVSTAKYTCDDCFTIELGSSPYGYEWGLNRMRQIYKRAFLSNILVDGQIVNDTEDEDTTSEFEPYDTEKENYIQHELMNKFDEQLVNTTRLRKTGPHIIRSHMKKTIRPELKYLALVNVTPECRDQELEVDHGVDGVQEDIETRLQGTAQTLEATKQDCEEMVVKSKDLLQALKLYVKTEKSNIHQVMSETPPSTPVTKSGHQNTCTSIKCEISKKLLL